MTPPKSLRPRRPSLVPSATTPSPAAPKSLGKKPRSMGGCGQCEACNREDCRQCVYCKDMRKYGGPNRLRKRCLHRRCTAARDAEVAKVEKKKTETTTQTTKSKRVIKQPKKLTPNHSAALSYDDNDAGVKHKIPTPQPPPAKRRKVEPAKKTTKPEPQPSVPKYGSGKRLAPSGSTNRPLRIPSPPKLTPPSPIVKRVTRRSKAAQAVAKSRSKIKTKKYVPKSLPFLVNTDIAGVIVRYEIRARNIAVQEAKGFKSGFSKGSGDEWKLEEVINFFRGVYLFGWGNWTKVQMMIKTRTIMQVESFANAKLQSYQELKRFFGRNNLHKLHQTYPAEKVKRMASAVPVPASANVVDPASTGWKTTMDKGLNNLSLAVLEMLEVEKTEAEEEEDAKTIEDTELAVQTPKEPDWLKESTPPFLLRPQDPTRGTFYNGKVAICLGGRVIETDNKAKPAQDSDTVKDATPKPELFNPKYRPSAPTANSQQIYIPGNRVYARWLNREDPGSYGTWYPGFVQSSRVSPNQSDYDEGLCDFPSLLYQVRFDDGVLSRDIKAEDIMMENQYETWLKELEDYYALPITDDDTKENLTSGQRVHARWVDPTDPDMHARWIPAVIVSCNGDKTGGDTALTFTYHVKFDEGDDDEELSSQFVLDDSVYEKLLQQKIDHGRSQNVSGIDLIHAASKISSPIKNPLHSSVSMNASAAGAVIPDLLHEDDDKSYATIESELLCHEVLDPPSPIPTTGSDDSSAPDVHYGLYMKIKPSVITPSIEYPKKITIQSQSAIPVTENVAVLSSTVKANETQKKCEKTDPSSPLSKNSHESAVTESNQANGDQTVEANVTQKKCYEEAGKAEQLPQISKNPHEPKDNTPKEQVEKPPKSEEVKSKKPSQPIDTNGEGPPAQLSLESKEKTNTNATVVHKANINGNNNVAAPSASVKLNSTPVMKKNAEEQEINAWCRRWVLDIFPMALEECGSRETLESESSSKRDFDNALIAMQLTQMRIMKKYIDTKESETKVSLSDKEKSDITYVCRESFVQLVSEIAFVKTGADAGKLTVPNLFERYKRICMRVRSETLKDVVNV